MRKSALFAGLFLFAFSTGALGLEPMTLQERVNGREALERVYHSKRIWPAENPGPRPTFEAVVSRAQIGARVEESLRKEAALREIWGKRVTPGMLQWEMDRMARVTRRPEVLSELWDALGRDPRLIAECLVRTLLVDRLLEASFQSDERRSANAGGPSGPMVSNLETAGLESQESLPPACSTGVREWWNSVRDRFRPERVESEDSYVLPRLEMAACAGDTWAATSLGPPYLPIPGEGAAAVWTGSEMIIWGPGSGDVPVAARYNPATDSWVPLNLDGAPFSSGGMSAVWTGTEMMVWGGQASRYGGRYNPATDTWTPTSTAAGCPTPRDDAALLWTGTEAIVWGGYAGSQGGDFVPSGARYNPATNLWSPLPSYYVDFYSDFAAVWTGSQMIVWGYGLDSLTSNTPVGARWDRGADQWLPMSETGAPEMGWGETSVWTGTEMIIYGGSGNQGITDEGGVYNPATDTWRPTNPNGAPSPRRGHTAVWTGTEMLIWGGAPDDPAGGRYNPATDSWLPMTTNGVPENRDGHVAVWTGTEMIVYGNSTDPGGRYDPASDRWTQVSGGSPPEARASHTAVWTGAEMIVWGGSDSSPMASGARYDPATDAWSRMAYIGEPESREMHSAGWTGTEMILWGGQAGGDYRGTGGRYNPASDSWVTMSAEGAPTPRRAWGAWTGTEFLIWGGYDGHNYLNDGARYSPATDSWAPMTTAGAPVGRWLGTATWADDALVVWGGVDSSYQYTRTGGRYYPAADTWAPTSETFTHWPREGHTAVWTGSRVAIWGGVNGYTGLKDGGLYDPVTDTWTYLTSTGAPAPRMFHSAVWTGSDMIVWGGHPNIGGLDTGGVYNPATGKWTGATSTAGAPEGRSYHTAVWTGSDMIVWGGKNASLKYLNTGGRYCVGPPPPPDFQVGLVPSTLELLQNETGFVAARVTSVGSFSEAVSLSCSGAPPGVTCVLDPASVTPAAGGTAESALSVTAASSTAPGTYVLEVSGTADGKTRSASLGLTVLPSTPCSLECEAWALPSAGAAPLAVAFTATATARNCSVAPSFHWDFGDGQTSISQNPKHTYSTPGSYVWTLTVTAEGLICSRTCDIAVGAYASGLPGDCDGDEVVSVGEIQKAINMFLNIHPPACWADFNGDGRVTVGEVQRVVNQYLGVFPECGPVGTGRGGAR